MDTRAQIETERRHLRYLGRVVHVYLLVRADSLRVSFSVEWDAEEETVFAIIVVAGTHRSKDKATDTASGRRRRLDRMSAHTAEVAVAVQARRGVPGNKLLRTESFLQGTTTPHTDCLFTLCSPRSLEVYVHLETEPDNVLS